ncbi:Nucleolar complex protein 2 [Erysiphe necator]|nr:Nucleolar complex protein 2 [Erysiphe necator]
MGKSAKKSTRKYEKNQLKDALERRKAGAKIKQRQQIKLKRKAKNAEKSYEKNEKDSGIHSVTEQDPVAKISVDNFFQNGIEIPEKTINAPESKSSERKNGKQKRKYQEADDNIQFETPVIDGSDLSDSEKEESGEEDDIGMSKDIMDGLAEKDPEFYKYLKENDPDTLDFDENSSLSELNVTSALDEEKPRKKRKKTNLSEDEETESSIIQIATVEKWTKAMTENYSLRAMRQVVLAFRAAAHVNEDENKHKYSISSPDVYHNLVISALKYIPIVLQHHLPVKESSGKSRVSTESKKFKTLTPLLKSHSISINHLLSNLSDSSTIKATLSSITILIPYLVSFKKILKIIIKTVVGIWADISHSEAIRITAFLALRRLMVEGDAGIRETVLKTVYQGLVRSSRSTTMHTIHGINLMKNSASELWGIDASVGYATGFTFIRQLAIHLRNSITKNQKESFKTVYNWQYLHSLDFWSCVLSEHCSPLREAENGKESELKPLIYPTVQITLGALRLIPTAMYFPLRFHLIRSLLRLSRATGTYIPLASSLLEVLNSNEMKNPPKSSVLKPIEFALNYKVPKSYLHTRVYQENIGEQVVELFAEFFVIWCTNIAYPELALPVVVMLKRWLKDVKCRNKGNKNAKVSNSIALLIQKLETNSKWIEEKRAKVDFAPNNRVGVDEFLKGFDLEKTPLGAFVMGQRKLRESKMKIIEEGRKKDEEVKKKIDKRQGSKEIDQDLSDEEDSN